MKNIKSHFRFNKQERSGIFFLLLFIVILQGLFFFIKNKPTSVEKAIRIDEEYQLQIDSLKNKVLAKNDSLRLFPFNPNFVSDYKGYVLGMSVQEIDRLHAFRAKNKYVNSANEFQKITKISDSLLKIISPRFKFPEWTQKNNKQTNINTNSKNNQIQFTSNERIIKKDINTTTAQDLREINGVGEKLSARIIKFRDRLGGFLINEQLYDVYGLETVVVDRILLKYSVLEQPLIKKININKASASEIAQLVYIPYSLAQNIVSYRENNGDIKRFEELKDIEAFPIEKINRIQLYLSLF